MGFKNTDEQVDIIDTVATGANTVIEAGAGCGKTHTLKLAALNEKKRQGLVIYFNRAPAAEGRRTFPANVKCSTAGSLAWHAMKHQPYMERLDDKRTVLPKQIAEDHLNIRKWFRTPEGRKDISTWKIASMAVRTVNRYCFTDDEDIQPWHVERIEGITGDVERELRQIVVGYAKQIWADVQQVDGFAQVTSNHVMKLWALGEPRLDADFLMVDESQDTNGVLAGIIRKQPDSLQRIFVGDSQQRLFSWRGTVDMISEAKDAEVRYLTQSFRFGQAVADEANLWLDYLNSPLRLKGLQSISSRLDYVETPDAILTRTNAAAIEQAMDAQHHGFSVAVVGGTDEMAAFARAVDDLKRTGKTSHRELSPFKTWPDVLEYVREEKPGGSFATTVGLIQRYGTGGVQRVAANCVDERDADFVISTVHKVKGLEWNRVRLDPTLAPDENEQPGDDMGKGELMVGYVATTRAREVLDATAVESFHARRSRLKEIRDPKVAS
jgi:superfamily I DNA/RNA helicase